VVEAAPDGRGFLRGDLVVGMIRRPCNIPCLACGDGRLDECASSEPRERGISGLDGFAAEFWTSDPVYLVPVPRELGERGILVEPLTSVIKGMRLVSDLEGQLTEMRRALVVGAGSIGLLTTMVLVARGLDVTILERQPTDRKVSLTREIGATFGIGSDVRRAKYDLVVECSGDLEVLNMAIESVGASGTILVLGLAQRDVLLSSLALKRLVVANIRILGSASATRDDHLIAATMLARWPQSWLDGLITHTIRPDSWATVIAPDPSRIKAVVTFK
jgi:threonine dehydrogenase-like Zn-dependent dehydrogenase